MEGTRLYDGHTNGEEFIEIHIIGTKEEHMKVAVQELGDNVFIQGTIHGKRFHFEAEAYHLENAVKEYNGTIIHLVRKYTSYEELVLLKLTE